ncbi:hypothetical protein ACE38W_19545 [Chitinophaga sp. Hz27]|uniref:hypothetical protein n=1 Tax=Chitinophaga sp. Hz27 TaxID=3347169 RepID=UPI0035D65D66
MRMHCLMLFYVIIFFSCTSKTVKSPHDNGLPVQQDTIKKRLANFHILTDSFPSSTPLQVLDSPPSFRNATISIVEYKIIADARLSTLDTMANVLLYKKCKYWKLDSATMVTLIRNAEAADADFIDKMCDVLPAQIVGYALIDGVEHQFFINAASHMIIFKGHVRGNYVWTDHKYRKYFLLPVTGE